jgi:hypothetical protein
VKSNKQLARSNESLALLIEEVERKIGSPNGADKLLARIIKEAEKLEYNHEVGQRIGGPSGAEILPGEVHIFESCWEDERAPGGWNTTPAGKVIVNGDGRMEFYFAPEQNIARVVEWRRVADAEELIAKLREGESIEPVVEEKEESASLAAERAAKAKAARERATVSVLQAEVALRANGEAGRRVLEAAKRGEEIRKRSLQFQKAVELDPLAAGALQYLRESGFQWVKAQKNGKQVFRNRQGHRVTVAPDATLAARGRGAQLVTHRWNTGEFD